MDPPASYCQTCLPESGGDGIRGAGVRREIDHALVADQRREDTAVCLEPPIDLPIVDFHSVDGAAVVRHDDPAVIDRGRSEDQPFELDAPSLLARADVQRLERAVLARHVDQCVVDGRRGVAGEGDIRRPDRRAILEGECERLVAVVHVDNVILDRRG